MAKKQNGYTECVAHIMETYKSKVGAKYPFTGANGRAVKNLLAHYGLDVVCALWDEFLDRDWDWYDKYNKKVRVAHDLWIFQAKLTELLEDGAYKKRIKVVGPMLDLFRDFPVRAI